MVLFSITETLKYKPILSNVLLLLLFSQAVFSINFVNSTTKNTINKSSSLLKNNILSLKFEIGNFLEPEATLINFEDVSPTGGYNSTEIAPNRYTGVSFYSPSPYSSTYVTYSNSYSYPNSLIVGYVCDTSLGTVCSNFVLAIDFTQDSKDVSFLWGRDSLYNSGTIEIYEGNNF